MGILVKVSPKNIVVKRKQFSEKYSDLLLYGGVVPLLHVELHFPSRASAAYGAQPNYLGSKPDSMKEGSEDENAET